MKKALKDLKSSRCPRISHPGKNVDHNQWKKIPRLPSASKCGLGSTSRNVLINLAFLRSNMTCSINFHMDIVGGKDLYKDAKTLLEILVECVRGSGSFDLRWLTDFFQRRNFKAANLSQALSSKSLHSVHLEP